MKAEFKEVPVPPRWCMVCRGEIPPERVLRHSGTCSDECSAQHKRDMMNVKAGKICRLCRRPFRRPRRVTIEEASTPLPDGCVTGTQGGSETTATAKNA